MVKVSVIIPTYNHANFIVEALESALDQTYGDLEVIIVNDGSPDNTDALLKPYIEAKKIRYVYQQNQGVAVARNTGVENSRGEFIAFLDDDDVWPPCKLEWQVAELESCDAVMLGGYCIHFKDSYDAQIDRTNGRDFARLVTADCFAGNPFGSPGQTLIRKSAFQAVGGCNPEMWGVDDLDLWIRLSTHGEIRQYNRLALYYRVHQTNASLNLLRMAENTERVIRDNLMRLSGNSSNDLERIGYRYLFRCAGKKLLWKGAKLVRQGSKEEGIGLIRKSISMFKPQWRKDPGLLLLFLLAVLKTPLKISKVP